MVQTVIDEINNTEMDESRCAVNAAAETKFSLFLRIVVFTYVVRLCIQLIKQPLIEFLSIDLPSRGRRFSE